MIFIIIYKNQEGVREQVESAVKDAIAAGHDLTKESMVHPTLFRTQFAWPLLGELGQIPLRFQCEEVEFKDNKLTVRRQLVIDV